VTVEIDTATRADADALAATFKAARMAAMPWLPELHSEAEDRRYLADHLIGACDVFLVRREGSPVAFLALKGDVLLAWPEPSPGEPLPRQNATDPTALVAPLR
jgi:hypothetical protein